LQISRTTPISDREIVSALRRTGGPFFGEFRSLTEIQREAIPHLLRGESALLIAGTGSGKTEAALAPCIERALTAPGRLRIVVISPTKALANDLYERVQAKADRAGMRVGVRHGDVDSLAGSIPSLLITTPESWDVLLSRPGPDATALLSAVQTVILDEAHLLFGSPRGEQVRFLIARQQLRHRGPLQLVLLSATISDPTGVARYFALDPAGLPIKKVGGHRALALELFRATARTPEEYASGLGFSVELAGRLDVADSRKALVFANSRAEVEWLTWRCTEALVGTGRTVFLHHSSLSPEARVFAEAGFRDAQRAVCFATNTLEVGIDIGDVDRVGLFGPPASVSGFVQRVGRSNRRDAMARAIGWYRDYGIDGRARDRSVDLRRFLGLAVALRYSELDEVPPGRHYGVLVQQVMSLLRRFGGRVSAGTIDSLAAKVWSGSVGVDIIQRLLQDLEEAGLVRSVGSGRGDYDADDVFHELAEQRAIFGNIGGFRGTTVESAGKAVASIPMASATPGSIIVIQGVPHCILTATRSSVVAQRLEPSTDATLVRYRGPGLPISAAIAKGVKALVAGRSRVEEVVLVDAADAESALTELRASPEPGEHRTYAGEVVNRLAAEWYRLKGVPVDGHDEYRIRLTSATALPAPADEETLWRDLSDVVLSTPGLLSQSPHGKYLGRSLREDEIRTLVPLESLMGVLLALAEGGDAKSDVAGS
jgi:ATP-dependent Lhr-like helicase